MFTDSVDSGMFVPQVRLPSCPPHQLMFSKASLVPRPGLPPSALALTWTRDRITPTFKPRLHLPPCPVEAAPIGWGGCYYTFGPQKARAQDKAVKAEMPFRKLLMELQEGGPLVDATWEAEAGESLESRRQRLQSAEITPLHSSLGNRARLHLSISQSTNKAPHHDLQGPPENVTSPGNHFGRPRKADHLSPEVLALSHDKTLSLLKIQKLTGVVTHTCNPSYLGGLGPRSSDLKSWRNPVSTKNTKIIWHGLRNPRTPCPSKDCSTSLSTLPQGILLTCRSRSDCNTKKVSSFQGSSKICLQTRGPKEIKEIKHYKYLASSQARWLTPVILAFWEAEVGGSRGQIKTILVGRAWWLTPVIQALWRPKQGDHLRSGVQDQPDQHGAADEDLQLQVAVRPLHDRLLLAQGLEEEAPVEGLPAAAAQCPQHPQAAPRPLGPSLQRLKQEAGGSLQLRPGRRLRALSPREPRVRGHHDRARVPRRPPLWFGASAQKLRGTEDSSAVSDAAAASAAAGQLHPLGDRRNLWLPGAAGIGAQSEREEERRGQRRNLNRKRALGKGRGQARPQPK
ncbi:hypothetical protein AAY473_006198 [Plecturocebus cupreus]